MRLLGYCLLAGLAAIIRKDYKVFCRELELTIAEARRSATRWVPR